jgi:hypothetical protein
MRPKRITKRRIGIIQLESSLYLLLNRNDPGSALTLAAAAEEIFGKLSMKHGNTPVVEDWAEYIGSFYDFFKKPRPPKKALIHAHNKIRNELKHNDSGKNYFVIADFQQDAEDMIIRAMKNYFNAFDCFPSHRNLRIWFDFITL